MDGSGLPKTELYVQQVKAIIDKFQRDFRQECMKQTKFMRNEAQKHSTKRISLKRKRKRFKYQSVPSDLEGKQASTFYKNSLKN